MNSSELLKYDFLPSEVLTLFLTNGDVRTFIFYSIFQDGITGYDMDLEESDLQFVPGSDIVQIIKAVE